MPAPRDAPRPTRLSDRPSTPSRMYSESYFLTDCEGYDGFDRCTTVDLASARLAASLRLVALHAGDRVLDVGCGRGEAVRYCARNGAVSYGVDYSADAVRIACQRMDTVSVEVRSRMTLSRADARSLPFADDSLDTLLMFDLVEHLYRWELDEALGEACRVLSDGGQLVIHTAPNLWYYRFGYPLYRLFERLRGRRLPRDPRIRFPFHHLHVNEQSVLSLRRSLRHAGFESKVWLDVISPPLSDERSRAIRLLMWLLLEVYPFRWVFRNDVFAIARKRRQH